MSTDIKLPPLPGQYSHVLACAFADYARAAVLADRATHPSALTARVAELEAHLRTIATFGGTLDQARELAAKGIERAALLARGPGCGCQTCRPITLTDMRMVLCETCGNKRCPHATDHRHACTNSNEPGQPGSNYT